MILNSDYDYDSMTHITLLYYMIVWLLTDYITIFIFYLYLYL